MGGISGGKGEVGWGGKGKNDHFDHFWYSSD